MTASWTLDEARRAYALTHWGDGYVDINAAGEVTLHPGNHADAAIALPQVVDAALAQGLRLPLLLRFPDILADRLHRLQAAFTHAIKTWDGVGGYTAIYPIKVNQQRAVAGELVNAGGDGFGLEAGSKPELMAVLALARPGSRVICNGYKDREYVRLALVARRLGLDARIVIEKPEELDYVVAESRALGITPSLGVRVRLASIGAGKWQNTGGAKGKFGLSPHQVLDLLAHLEAAGLKDCLTLLHFHMGSQIPNVRDVASGMREAVRHYVELCHLGVPIDTVDAGGGLGVDYEGTRSRSFNSINYSLAQYAAAIVQPLAEACRAEQLPMPHLLTEAGRAMTAHHAVLVVDVTAVDVVPDGMLPPPRPDAPPVLRRLCEVHAALDERPLTELYQEARFHLAEGRTLYALGQLSLTDRAALDDVWFAIANGLRARLSRTERAHRQVLDELDEHLVDKYFGNFSVFESIPDVWAIDQMFPIMPIARLNEAPTRRGVLVDMTCDSDGRIDHYVGANGVEVSLPLHPLQASEPYRLGIFMVGAYQETLGDIHNLFGDTDAVNVRLADGHFVLDAARRGDNADALLDYVGYKPDDLRAAYRARMTAKGLDAAAAASTMDILEAGLTGYTYLQQP